MQTDTAHQTWNAPWGTREGRAEWLSPDPEVREVAERLAAARSQALSALDLGCGIGRHALMFAALGFETTAADMAEQGLAELDRAAAAEGLPSPPTWRR